MNLSNIGTAFLVGDSGGTNTSWCYVDREGTQSYFETESYHPQNWNSDFFKEMNAFWQGFKLPKNLKLYFYGAGMGTETNRQKLKHHFKQFDFDIEDIDTDAMGALKAFHGKEKGYLAILGTGSILMRQGEAGDITKTGGLGHVKGDEGSGFYFGKILIKAWMNNQLSVDLCRKLNQVFTNKEKIWSQVNSAEGKKKMSQMAKMTSSWSEFSELSTLHEQNIAQFVKTHLLEKTYSNWSIVIIGSYAAAQAEIIQNKFKNKKFESIRIISSPIKEMVSFLVSGQKK